MRKKVATETNFTNSQSKLQDSNKTKLEIKNKYFRFFEYAPIALWIEDFSEVKNYVEKGIKESNLDIKSFVENNNTLIQKLTSLVKIKEVNATAVKLYKAKDKIQLLENIAKVFTEESLAGFSQLVIDILIGEKESSVETAHRTLEGEEINVLVKFSVEDGSEQTLENVIVSIENITDRINTRKELAKSEKRYREAQEIAKIGSWYYDFSTNKIHWSDEAYKLIGIEPQSESLSLDFYLSHIHVDDRNLVKDFSLDFLLKKPNQNLRYRIITKQGDIKHINETIASLKASSETLQKSLESIENGKGILSTMIYGPKDKSGTTIDENTLVKLNKLIINICRNVAVSGKAVS